MPSMPRLSTPERSHSSAPRTPNMSGVAIRMAASQKLAEIRMSSTPCIEVALAETDAETQEQPADQHAQQRQRNDQIGDVVGNTERAAHGIRADEDAGNEDRRRDHSERSERGHHGDDDAGI